MMLIYHDYDHLISIASVDPVKVLLQHVKHLQHI